MGGTVAVTIKKDNQLKKMARKTGSYNHMFFSEEFLNNDIEKAIKDYCQIFDGMREDYLKGEPYKYAMSGAYGWCDQMIPVDYGFVFIDLDKKEIHSMQGYDVPGKFNMMEINEYCQGHEIKKEFILKDKMDVVIKEDVSNKKTIVEFFKTDNIEELRERMKKVSSSYKNVETLNILEKTIGKIFSPLLNHNEKKLKSLCDIDNPIDMHYVDFYLKGWTIKSYSEDIAGIIELFHEVKQYLNEEEINCWKECLLKEFDEYYDDVMEEMDKREASEEEFDNYLEMKKKEAMSQFDNESKSSFRPY